MRRDRLARRGSGVTGSAGLAARRARISRAVPGVRRVTPSQATTGVFRNEYDEKKAARERKVFEDFISRSGLPIDRQSIRKCDPPEPDILCKVSGEYVAFELAEVCSPEIPRAISHIPRTGGVSNFIRSGDPVSEIARKKIKKSKNYRTDYPIELLFYTDGRVVQAPDMSIPSIQDSFNSDTGRFRRVWFMGQPNETYECVVDET